MNTTEQITLTVDEAIRISKFICSVGEERLPIILDVFAKAGVHINGLDELEEWKAMKDQGYLVDMDEFVSVLTAGQRKDKEVHLTSEEFADICRRCNVKPSCAKRALHRKGLIKTSKVANKINYTVPVWIDGRTERRIVILNKGVPDD